MGEAPVCEVRAMAGASRLRACRTPNPTGGRPDENRTGEIVSESLRCPVAVQKLTNTQRATDGRAECGIFFYRRLPKIICYCAFAGLAHQA